MSQSNQRYLCIHGHFYQPPRENPWLETVEVQDSAAPYHDWNERVTNECYATNGAARIVNSKGEIKRIVNNYSRISFNFGPTLLAWLEANANRTYRMILDADRASAARFSGHGSAMAQVYNHIILPLANRRDKLTQIRWGLADFERRFQRPAEGMWLAETAVDRESLDLIASEGVKFVVLAPHQCAHIRPLNKDGAWIGTPHASVNTRVAYSIPLDEGRSIAAFFYNGPLSRAVAFERLLDSGEEFARRLLEGFDHKADPSAPQLVHIATDGESYGHHHRHGEMALAYALHKLEQGSDAQITIYGEFLERFPPTWEAEVVDNSSWSCSHGIERWRADCGCNGGRAGWNQKWRAPLRDALAWLRDETATMVEAAAVELFHDVWKARDAYIEVILDRGGNALEIFLSQYAARILTKAEAVRAAKLMEIGRNAMLMYTSCGWFFDDISGIETVQVIAYAGRVLQLAREVFGAKGAALEKRFVLKLAKAKSNSPGSKDGAWIYQTKVKPQSIGLEQVGAHYAISSLFQNYPDISTLFSYEIRRTTSELLSSGRIKFAVGRAEVRSSITRECEDIHFAVLHFGDQNLTAAVQRDTPAGRTSFESFAAQAILAFGRSDFPAIIRQLDRYMGTTAYSLHSLFQDEQRRILNLVLQQTLVEVENSMRAIYDNHASLLHFMAEAGLPKPAALMFSATFVINRRLQQQLERDDPDPAQLRILLGRVATDQIELDAGILGFAATQRAKRALVEVEESGASIESLDRALCVMEAVRTLPFEVTLWQAQNIWNHVRLMPREAAADLSGLVWNSKFDELGRSLMISVEDIAASEVETKEAAE